MYQAPTSVPKQNMQIKWFNISRRNNFYRQHVCTYVHLQFVCVFFFIIYRHESCTMQLVKFSKNVYYIMRFWCEQHEFTCQLFSTYYIKKNYKQSRETYLLLFVNLSFHCIHPLRSYWTLLHGHYTCSGNEDHLQYRLFQCHSILPETIIINEHWKVKIYN